jgi:hypothetical protein
MRSHQHVLLGRDYVRLIAIAVIGAKSELTVQLQQKRWINATPMEMLVAPQSRVTAAAT